MQDSWLLHHLVERSAARAPRAIALGSGTLELDYATLSAQIAAFAGGVLAAGLARHARIGVYLDKRAETVIASFGASAAGCVMVPINPQLKPAQVAHILQDCEVALLVTSTERLATLAAVLPACAALRHVVLTGEDEPAVIHPRWDAFLQAGAGHRPAATELDMAAILYTSGSTGHPKGVVLSHRNLVAGARSVTSYLGNHADDRLLAALPLSFDAGFSQLTTAFHAGARAVLLNYLMPRDIVKALERERITGLTGVPPLWNQLAGQALPPAARQHLRYIANTGGHLPRTTLARLREQLPDTRVFLMYGLTEAFRATYLPPEEIDRKPDSMGRAIPDNEVFVLREDGSECAPDEAGELVQRGPLVAMGYWNDAARTAERFRPLPAALRPAGLTLPELAVFSGDTVRRDADGFLYFVGRRDEMIKTSGYRVSPTEIEDAAYATGLVTECAALGVPHAALGAVIVLVAQVPAAGDDAAARLLAALRRACPAWQVPARIVVQDMPLARNANGKIDRKGLANALVDAAGETP
ncbi:MAG: acyl-CoA ligase (AMP-forming), exosortase A system-associated [Candidatus Dactylopiibacterium sp.]|nr:acyl-CoA ligase (AMP-forming), exosortase A system-associated [Candidatus Dactylopiibacterium sp.]